MDGRQIHRIQLHVVLAIEALVGALGVVHDVYGEIAVVPVATVLTADLFAWDGGIGSGPATNGLVVSEEGREPREGPETVHVQRIRQVPGAHIEFIEKVVELADEISCPVLPRNGFPPLV
jgi:hypothetical protein